MSFLYALPGAVAEGLIWGLMAIGVYISYKILDIADLTVDGSICTGGCVCAVLIAAGVPIWVAMIAAFLAGALTGVITGLFHTAKVCSRTRNPEVLLWLQCLQHTGARFLPSHGWY